MKFIKVFLPAAISVLMVAVGTERAIGSVEPETIPLSPGGMDGVTLRTDGTARYIVRFREPPLATYDGGTSGLAKVAHVVKKNGRTVLDVHSAQAQAYVSYLNDLQTNRLDAMKTLLGHPVVAHFQMQHALNAVVVSLTPNEAQQIRQIEGVEAVNKDVERHLSTDRGPGFIGAASAWWGTRAGQDTLFAAGFDDTVRVKGDGIVIGDIDSGYNSQSPSFSATDDTGYTITNPLGAGVYRGQCGVMNISRAGCNAKVIGVYDKYTPAAGSGTTTVEDAGGHGSHTGSTAGGNTRSATIRDYTTRISGVAPHANMIIYRTCGGTNGTCPQSATTAAANQAVADGIVDVINFSISGGTDPWNDDTSQAFLNATAAGILVVAAGGNTGPNVPTPVPGSVNHSDPWVLTVAASTHTSKAASGPFNVTGPGTPPSNVQNLVLNEVSGSAYTRFSMSLPGTTPIILSPNFNIHSTVGGDGNPVGAGMDGCSAYPPNTFQNAIAVISRGTCPFSTKVPNAIAAGAIAVLISNYESINTPTGATLGTAMVSRPTFGISGPAGLALQSFLSTHTGATMQLPYHYERQTTPPDMLADFSLLGPGSLDVLKPELEAPGVSILAAINNDTAGTSPNRVDFFDGTSMATPHTTGAAALVMQAHPTWSPMEVKSALMLTTSSAGLTKPDGTTPSTPLDRGAGSLRVDKAIKTGLVLRENDFLRVKPSTNGDPSTLNLPSMYKYRCFTQTSSTTSTDTCSFDRYVTDTGGLATSTQYALTTTGVPATVTPSTLNINPNETRGIHVTVDVSSFPSDGAHHFGELILTPTNQPSLPTLHMPIAVAKPAPTLHTTSAIEVDIPSGSTTGSGNFGVVNIGGPTLNVTTNYISPSALGYYPVVNQPDDPNGSALFSSKRTNAPTTSIYIAEDFDVVASTGEMVSFSTIKAYGFMGTNTAATAPLETLTGHAVHFEIYGDVYDAVAGTHYPNGDPDGNSFGAVPPIWSTVETIGMSPALHITGSNITLNLDALSGGAPAFTAGKYWLVIYPEANYMTEGGWAWATSAVGQGSPITAVGGAAGADWGMVDAYPGVALVLEQPAFCAGLPWLSIMPATLALPGSISRVVTAQVNSTLFGGPGPVEVGYLCMQSNDATTPLTLLRIRAVQH